MPRSYRDRVVRLLVSLAALSVMHSMGFAIQSDDAKRDIAELRVVDAETSKGVPLVELEMVNGLRFLTDNAGRVAFQEPGLFGTEVHFLVRSHGYELEKDGFGFRGIKITPHANQVSEIRLTRRNIATRCCRLTGEGLYRDSILLGYEPPIRNAWMRARVAGQDSVQAALFQDKVYWVWGDTQQIGYPLGLFRVAGATTPIPDPRDPNSNPEFGIDYQYWTDSKTGFARAMMPMTERPEGVIWIHAMLSVPDKAGKQCLVGYYSRRASLNEMLDHGIAVFDEKRQEFVSVLELPKSETWRMPNGHPILYEDAGRQYLLCGSPSPNVRVPANLESVLDATQYEALTCVELGSGEKKQIQRDEQGHPVWRWQKELPPIDSKTEHQYVREKKMAWTDTRFCPSDVSAPSERVELHSGTVRWNAYRNRWILVAGQIHGNTSLLGEVWYAEADEPTGPFRQAIKIATHDRQSFYNVCHHAFLDRDDGSKIYFEGTYTNDFSGNPDKTPRYNYNQVLYELDLKREALQRVR